MSSRFQGRNAIVTGSTQGLGRALLERMADEGLSGAIVTGRSVERGNDVVAGLAARGCEATFVSADLADPDDAQRIIEIARESYGVVHHLANCAAITDRGSILDTGVDLFDAMMAVNVRAPFLLIQGVARMARAAGTPASIVNIGSVVAWGGPEILAPYSISKGALMTLTRNAAYALMRDRIRVVAVNPGWMDTPGEDVIQRRYHDGGDTWLAEAEATLPFGRLIKIDEIVNTLAFVLSDEAGMMTGTIIDFDQSVRGAGPVPVQQERLR
ncbi:MAG: SDR family oxidoreductase [Acidimicrobiales bacterium]|nr:SDR family oxidoreductase [Acidimicrobiales bacterium]